MSDDYWNPERGRQAVADMQRQQDQNQQIINAAVNDRFGMTASNAQAGKTIEEQNVDMETLNRSIANGQNAETPFGEITRGKDIDPSVESSTEYKSKNVLSGRGSLSQTPVAPADTSSRANTDKTARTDNISDQGIKNAVPKWWDYMRDTSGEKRGAISRIAGGVLQGLGNAAQGFAHGASLGKTPAPQQGQGDAFGIKEYGDFKRKQIDNQIASNARTGELNQNEGVANNQFTRGEVSADNAANRAENAADNAAARNERIMAINQQYQEKLNDQNFRNGVDMLIQNFENTKELKGIDEKQAKSLQDFAAKLKAGDNVRAFNALADSGIDADTMAKFVKRIGGQRFFDDFMGVFSGITNAVPKLFSSGGYTGYGGKNEPAGIVHKGEYVIPKKDVDQSTGEPKPEAVFKFVFGAKKKPQKKELTMADKLDRIKRWA